MVAVEHAYPDNDISDEEHAFGFRRSGVNVIVRFALGLLAVKIDGPGGAVEYAICDDELRPLYRSARSLDELQTRFGIGLVTRVTS